MKIPKVKRPAEEVLAMIHSLKREKGKIAVIEPDTGDWFLGKTLLEALKEAKRKYPGKIFYSIRVDSAFAHEHNRGVGLTTESCHSCESRNPKTLI